MGEHADWGKRTGNVARCLRCARTACVRSMQILLEGSNIVPFVPETKVPGEGVAGAGGNRGRKQ
jgi:hypothetical protein